MYKIETAPEHLLEAIRTFYTPERWHFITITGIDTGEAMQIVYTFSALGEVDSFRHLQMTLPYEAQLPSIASLVANAWIAEAELVDLFGLSVEGAKGGLFLDEDGIKAPLRRSTCLS